MVQLAQAIAGRVVEAPDARFANSSTPGWPNGHGTVGLGRFGESGQTPGRSVTYRSLEGAGVFRRRADWRAAASKRFMETIESMPEMQDRLIPPPRSLMLFLNGATSSARRFWTAEQGRGSRRVLFDVNRGRPLVRLFQPSFRPISSGLTGESDLSFNAGGATHSSGWHFSWRPDCWAGDQRLPSNRHRSPGFRADLDRAPTSCRRRFCPAAGPLFTQEHALGTMAGRCSG